MFGRGGLGIALAVAAGSMLLWQAAGAQALRFPKRCAQHPVAKPAQKVFIEKVAFRGESSPPGLSQEGLVALLRERVQDAGSGWLARAWETVRGAWQDRGYFQAVVDVEPQKVSASASQRYVSFKIHVDPGPLYRVAEVHLRAANPGEKLVFSEPRLRDLIPLHPGEILNLRKAREGLSALRELYASKGYIDFAAVPGFQIDNRTDRVTLSLFLDQGKQYRVGSVQIYGLDPYLKPKLRARIVPGSVFDWSRVLDFYEAEKESLLPGVSPADDEIRRDPKTGKVDLILDFRACPEATARGF